MATMMIVATRMTMVTKRKLEVIMRKLEVVHKEVGGYLSMAQIDDHQSVTDQM